MRSTQCVPTRVAYYYLALPADRDQVEVVIFRQSDGRQMAEIVADSVAEALEQAPGVVDRVEQEVIQGGESESWW